MGLLVGGRVYREMILEGPALCRSVAQRASECVWSGYLFGGIQIQVIAYREMFGSLGNFFNWREGRIFRRKNMSWGKIQTSFR